ncbi:MAG TPA: hypothetical protein VL049_07965 [Candidatus Dormibacteraeota bacterium]|nr:hypothetical protein [Candidatus Dormibacteraeota bacterium]
MLPPLLQVVVARARSLAPHLILASFADALHAPNATSLRPVRARLVGRARHASLAFNPDDAGTARIAVASAVPIAADDRPIAVVVFEALKYRPAAPSVPVPPDRGLTANIRQRADAQCGRERCRPLAPLGTRTAMEIAA